MVILLVDMPPEVLAAIITSGTALTTAGASGVASSKLNKATREFNREEAAKQREWSEQMAAQQNQWNIDLFNRANEYNTPAAQVERMREAGLNPLFYGLDGNQSVATPSAAQPLGYERAHIGNLINPIGSAVDAALRVAQISNVQANTSKTLNENLTETQKRENMQADLALVKQELNNKLAEEGLTDAQKQRVLKDISWIDRLNNALVSEKESRSKLDDAQRRRINALVDGEKFIQAKTIEDFEHRWNKIAAEIAKMSAETGLLEEDLSNYALNRAQSGLLGSGLSLVNLLRLDKETRPKFRDMIFDNVPSGVR